MSLLKTFSKILFYSLAFIGLVLLAVGIWFHFLWQTPDTEAKLAQLVLDIQHSDRVPANFVETTQKIYPEIFSLHDHFPPSLNTQNREQFGCSCLLVTRSFDLEYTSSHFVYSLKRFSLLRELERRVSIEDCFHYWMMNSYSYGNHYGLQKMSLALFGKDIQEISLDEQLQLLVLMKGAVFDPRINPQEAKEEVEKLRNKMKEVERGRDSRSPK